MHQHINPKLNTSIHFQISGYVRKPGERTLVHVDQSINLRQANVRHVSNRKARAQKSTRKQECKGQHRSAYYKERDKNTACNIIYATNKKLKGYQR